MMKLSMGKVVPGTGAWYDRHCRPVPSSWGKASPGAGARRGGPPPAGPAGQRPARPGDTGVLATRRELIAMPIATPEIYAQMLDRAKEYGFAYPAINVTSSQTLNAALRGFADAESDGIVQV